MSSHEEKLLSKNGFLKSAIWGMNYLMVLGRDIQRMDVILRDAVCWRCHESLNIVDIRAKKGRRGTHPDGQAEQLQSPEG